MPERGITVLVENTAGGRGLLAEHGLSLWIKTGRSRVLFDTGQGHVLETNARHLGIRLESLDAIALSHGHYDHTGGLSGVLSLAKRPRVYLHPQALDTKYARGSNNAVREVGITQPNAQALDSQADLVWVKEPTEIADSLWLTGPVPRAAPYEDTGGAFFRDAACREPDELPDDQAAFLETNTGTVVILGCAHSGIINTLEYIVTLTSHRPIRAVIGGMHLLHAGPERMEATIAAFRRLEIGRLIPCHCTGFAAIARLWNEFPGRCETCPVGAVFSFGDA